jgi:O-acetylserine/cysteine efflux transporter
LGYGIWNTLLSRHPSSVVAPFSMLVPVVGVLSSWLFFDELPDLIELIAGVAVVGGVLYASRPPRTVTPVAADEEIPAAVPVRLTGLEGARGDPS